MSKTISSQKTPNVPPKPKSAEVLEPLRKPALVLVHGFRGAPLGLEVIANDLRQAGYEVYVPALPPFAGAKLPEDGKSNLPLSKQYATYLRNFIRTAGVERPILIGHSLGSVAVTATARYFPELTHQKLVLLSPLSTKPARAIASIAPLSGYLPPRVVDYVTTRFLFVPHDKKMFHGVLALTRKCSSDQVPSRPELNNAIKFSTRYSVADFLQGLQKDLILIAGAKDRLISRKATQKLADMHSAKLELIPGSGHLHNYEKPHETAQLIIKHIAS